MNDDDFVCTQVKQTTLEDTRAFNKTFNKIGFLIVIHAKGITSTIVTGTP